MSFFSRKIVQISIFKVEYLENGLADFNDFGLILQDFEQLFRRNQLVLALQFSFKLVRLKKFNQSSENQSSVKNLETFSQEFKSLVQELKLLQQNFKLLRQTSNLLCKSSNFSAKSCNWNIK